MAPSIWQILIVLVIVLLLFGTKRLRNVGSDLGAAIKGFRKGMSDGDKDDTPSEQLSQDGTRPDNARAQDQAQPDQAGREKR